jgi:hypothetical protein
LTYIPGSKAYPLGTESVEKFYSAVIDKNDYIYIRTPNGIIAFNAMERRVEYIIDKPIASGTELCFLFPSNNENGGVFTFDINLSNQLTIEHLENEKQVSISNFSLDGQFTIDQWYLTFSGIFLHEKLFYINGATGRFQCLACILSLFFNHDKGN